MEDLEEGLLEYETAGEFLADIKKEFGERDKEIVKVAELKMIEQGGKTMEKLYEERPLVKEFKRGINGAIC